MKPSKIMDKDVTSRKYAGFEQCRICNKGKSIKFILAGGFVYHVSIDYFLAWYSQPHYFHRKNKWSEVDNAVPRRSIKNIRFMKQRRVIHKTALRVYLNNDTAYDVPWDVVLMACEERYEHFGGLTAEFKQIVQNFRPTRVN